MTQRVCVTGATGMDRPSADLLAIDRARRVLGFEPRHSWRDQMT